MRLHCGQHIATMGSQQDAWLLDPTLLQKDCTQLRPRLAVSAILLKIKSPQGLPSTHK